MQDQGAAEPVALRDGADRDPAVDLRQRPGAHLHVRLEVDREPGVVGGAGRPR